MSEENIQINFVKYLDNLPLNTNIIYSMIPNDTFTSSINQKNRNMYMGLRGGLPDMFLIVRNKPFFIEFKTSIGRLSIKQEKWINKIQQASINVYVCRSTEEAIKVIDNYL
jgi:hypothetical protein